MKLYEINEAIQRLADLLDIDEETGEMLGDSEKVLAEIHALQMEKDEILRWLAKVILNERAKGAALKAEEQRIRGLRKRSENKEERLLAILDRECAGQKKDLGIATFNYRQSERVEVADAAKAVKWLKRKKLFACYREPEPEIFKSEVKRLIKSGVKVPCCSIVSVNNYSLK